MFKISSSEKSALIRLASTFQRGSENRRELLAFLKEAREFPNQKALDKYLRDHPGADRRNHSVRKPAPKKKDLEFDKEHRVHLDGITKEDFRKFLEHPEGRELQDKYNL